MDSQEKNNRRRKRSYYKTNYGIKLNDHDLDLFIEWHKHIIKILPIINFVKTLDIKGEG